MPAQAGIQFYQPTGCRIKSGMTGLQQLGNNLLPNLICYYPY